MRGNKAQKGVGRDVPPRLGWWIASDGKWYPPQLRPGQKKSHKARLIVVGLVALVVIIIAASSSSGNKTSTQTAPAPASAPAPAPVATAPPAPVAPAPAPAPAPSASQIGQTVKDGNFSFVVQSFVCGAPAATAVNPDGYGETVPPGAQECVATIAVTADKGQAQTFFAGNQYGFDASSRQYSADEMGAVYITNSNDVAQVNPGITVVAIVPFQIPAGTTLTKLVLHDSAFSGGVSVHL